MKHGDKLTIEFSTVPEGMRNPRKGEMFNILSLKNGRLRLIREGIDDPVEFWFTFNKTTGRYDPDVHDEGE